MLTRYFKYPSVLRRMRLGPLGREINIVADDLKRTGYTYLSAKRYLSLIASFSRYALKSGCVPRRCRVNTFACRLVDHLNRYVQLRRSLGYSFQSGWPPGVVFPTSPHRTTQRESLDCGRLSGRAAAPGALRFSARQTRTVSS